MFLAMLRSRDFSHLKNRGKVGGSIKHVNWSLMCTCALNFRIANSQSVFTTPGSVFEFLRQFFAQVDFKKISFEPCLLPYVRDRLELEIKSKARRAEIFLSDPVHDTPHVNLLSGVGIEKIREIQDGLRNLTRFELKHAWTVTDPRDVDVERASATMYKAPPDAPIVPPPAKAPRSQIQVKAAPPALRAQLGIDPPRAAAESAPPQAAAASTALLPCAAAALGSETAAPQPAAMGLQQPAPAAVAASGNLKLPPSWQTTTSYISVPLVARRGCTITRAKIDKTHEVVVSYPPSAQEPTLGFGQLPIVFYVGGAGCDTIITDSETKAMKKAGGAKFSREFLHTIDSVIWISAVADARAKKPWKMQPEMWMLEAAIQLRAFQSMPIHFIGFSRGGWWGSVFAAERPDLFASIWLVGGYPATSEVHAHGVASATALRQCHAVSLIGSNADDNSPAQAYNSWYAMEPGPNHRSVVFESLTHQDLLAIITNPPAVAEALSRQLHTTLVET